MSKSTEFSKAVIEELGYYVYIYSDLIGIKYEQRI